MARELQNPTMVVIIGSATGPSLCISDYRVVNADMQEPTKLHEEAAPDFTVAASAVVADCITDIKAAESL
jgi:hypothetical protein